MNCYCGENAAADHCPASVSEDGSQRLRAVNRHEGDGCRDDGDPRSIYNNTEVVDGNLYDRPANASAREGPFEMSGKSCDFDLYREELCVLAAEEDAEGWTPQVTPEWAYEGCTAACSRGGWSLSVDPPLPGVDGSYRGIPRVSLPTQGAEPIFMQSHASLASMRTLLLALVLLLPGAAQALQTLRILTSADVSQPVFLASPVGDERLFVVERSGKIVIYQDGALRAMPFLDLRDSVALGSPFGEGGLLGLAFPADYAQSGFFYVYYTSPGALPVALTSRVSRFRVSADPNRAEAASELRFLSLAQPYANHNGGTLAVRDGYLYLGVGDGGSGNDPGERAQDNSNVFGQMVRWSLSGDVPGPLEAYAYGLRNPFRFSFDRSSGDLYIGDVGQDAREEIDIQAAGDHSFRNYGWDVMEGSLCQGPSPGEPACFDASFTPPAWEYFHDESGPCSGSVTGGVVYRGSIREIQGEYFFADYCSNSIWSFRWDGDPVLESEVVDRTDELSPVEGSIENIVAFGEDGFGEMYIVDGTGEVYRVLPEPGREAFAAVLASLAWLARRRRRSDRPATESTTSESWRSARP
jgi:glucose/arabinose dehydrogenase